MEDQQVPLNREARADAQPEGDVQVVLPDLAYQQLLIVNVLFYGASGAGDREWILIDTVALQQPELHGPPMYYTADWDAAQHSVERLASLEPELVITGHGPALQGEKMRAALQTLARDFKQIAVPG